MLDAFPWLQPGDPSRNALDTTSLFSLSGLTKHVQLGFSLLPPVLPHERNPMLSDRGIILQKEVGCWWKEQFLLLPSEHCCFCGDVLCRVVGAHFLPYIKHKSTLFSYLCGSVHSAVCRKARSRIQLQDSPNLGGKFPNFGAAQMVLFEQMYFLANVNQR